MNGPFDNFLIRASSFGHINHFTGGVTEKQQQAIDELVEKKASKGLTEKQQETLDELIAKKNTPLQFTKTAQAYLLTMYWDHVKGFYEETKNKYFVKGKETEVDGIKLMNKTIFRNRSASFQYSILKQYQNKQRVSDEFSTGECDVEFSPELVIDLKNCWSWKTLHEAEMTFEYEWQLRVYMKLYNCEKAMLFYYLTNPSEDQLDQLCKRMFFEKQMENNWLDMSDKTYEMACDKLREMYNFDKFPEFQRFRVFSITRNLELEKQIEDVTTKARFWLNLFHKKQQNIEETNKTIIL